MLLGNPIDDGLHAFSHGICANACMKIDELIGSFGKQNSQNYD